VPDHTQPSFEAGTKNNDPSNVFGMLYPPPNINIYIY